MAARIGRPVCYFVLLGSFCRPNHTAKESSWTMTKLLTPRAQVDTWAACTDAGRGNNPLGFHAAHEASLRLAPWPCQPPAP